MHKVLKRLKKDGVLETIKISDDSVNYKKRFIIKDKIYKSSFDDLENKVDALALHLGVEFRRNYKHFPMTVKPIKKGKAK